MIRSLRTGVSGLKSHQVRMDVISNNIANVNTTAFKRGRAAFNELLGQTLLGVGRTAGGRGINPAYVGLGVSVGSIDVNFAQGALENTGVATDLGINGDGFFVVRGGDRTYLTRAGNFMVNRFGELVTNSGLQVQGWAFDENGELRSAALEDVRIPFSATAPPKQTENIYVRGNLNAEASTQDPVIEIKNANNPLLSFTYKIEREDIYRWSISIIDDNNQVVASDIHIVFDENWNITDILSQNSDLYVREYPSIDPNQPSTFILQVNNYDPDGTGGFPISFTFSPPNNVSLPNTIDPSIIDPTTINSLPLTSNNPSITLNYTIEERSDYFDNNGNFMYHEWKGKIVDQNGNDIAQNIIIHFDQYWNIINITSSDSNVEITEYPSIDSNQPSSYLLHINNYDPDNDGQGNNGPLPPIPVSFTFMPANMLIPSNTLGPELKDIGEKTTISTVIYDAQGKDSSVILEFTRINSLENGDPQDEWALRILDRDGQPLHTGYLAKLIYDTRGTLTEIRAVDGSLIDDLSGDGELTLPVSLDFNGDGLDETFTLNLAGADDALTQYAGSTTATVRDQDGQPPGSLIGFSINQEGIVELNFSNGYQQKIYQLALGSVNNVNGLQQVGDNLWSLTSSSGDLALGRAGIELNRTVIVAGTLEMSNVDLATEFTDMIVTQRGYQASARIITTSDEMLQELVQLKR